MSSGEILRALLDGASITIQVTVYAATWGTVVAVLLGLASLSPIRPLRWFVRVYVEVLRGVSAIILLFWVFFALPQLLDVFLSPLTAGVLALGLNLSAYGTELVRGALQAVPRGQTEAAIAVNLSFPQRTWSIILPQAAAIALPPYGNLLIEVMKASALVSTITLSDITFEAQNLRQLGEDTVEVFTIALLIYFAISLVITATTRLLEARFGRGLDTGRGVGAPK